MQPDVIAQQETHLNPSDKLKIPNYSAYRTDRTTHRVGGTALLVKNSIDHRPTPNASTPFENTTVNLDLPNNNNISITSIYRPPHGRINTQELDRLFSQSSKAIVVGNYNAKHPAWSVGRSNTNGSLIHDHIANNNFVLLTPLEPTHFPYHHPSSSTLDFRILKNISSGDASSINDLSSDHNPVSFEINVNASLASPAKKPELVSPQVISLIKKLNPRKATGPEGVSNKALRMLTLNSVTHLTEIFNKCIVLHHFPDSWKLAHVLMFPKPNQNHKLSGSYRPNSLLSNIGKLFEKVLLKRLNDHCLKNSIIPAEQFGFRSGHSCSH
ncbi:RNA-directed DNA polymerase from mobile element jockey [Araneus ventricosus]|uniref:RNA-directed DNA polymerase from mobile element jockey n=1 Tax=Araneus ventricosus TaxID=182803 RepID=A0A4Y2IIL8_ARAVE|nr:RNA-directed DNA polymerase from mobile element jockey [Araneus ventricosus]